MAFVDGFIFDAAEKKESVSISHTCLDDNDISDIEAPADSQTQAHPRKDLSKYQWLWTCIGMNICAVLFGLDTTISGDVQASIYESLGDIHKLPWVGIAFPMGSVASVLLFGKCADAFDIKWLFLASIITFEIGSLLCGIATSMDVLIVGRAIAGVGGCGMYIGNLAYYAAFTTVRERPMFMAFTGVCWGTGAILGPVVGGLFSTLATWRWAFYINLPLAALAAPIQLWQFPRYNPLPGIKLATKFGRIDWLGTLLHVIVFVSILIALTFSGSAWAWKSAPAICTWAIFGVATILYGVQQYFCIATTKESRIFPLQCMYSRTMLLLYLTTAVAATGLGVGLYYIPLFFQFTQQKSALETAVRLLPFIITFIVAVFLAGGLLPYYGRYAPFYIPSGILLLTGATLMYNVHPTISSSAIYGFEVLLGAGVGLTFQNAHSIAAALVSADQLTAASGFINVGQLGSVAISLAMSGCLFQNLGVLYLREALQRYGVSDEMIRAALAGTDASGFAAADPRIRELALAAVVKTISGVWVLVIAGGALNLVCACCMKWEKLKMVRPNF